MAMIHSLETELVSFFSAVKSIKPIETLKA